MYTYYLEVLRVEPSDALTQQKCTAQNKVTVRQQETKPFMAIRCMNKKATCYCTSVPASFTIEKATSQEETLRFTYFTPITATEATNNADDKNTMERSEVSMMEASEMLQIGGLYRDVGICWVPIKNDSCVCKVHFMWEIRQNYNAIKSAKISIEPNYLHSVGVSGSNKTRLNQAIETNELFTLSKASNRVNSLECLRERAMSIGSEKIKHVQWSEMKDNAVLSENDEMTCNDDDAKMANELELVECNNVCTSIGDSQSREAVTEPTLVETVRSEWDEHALARQLLRRQYELTRTVLLSANRNDDHSNITANDQENENEFVKHEWNRAVKENIIGKQVQMEHKNKSSEEVHRSEAENKNKAKWQMELEHMEKLQQELQVKPTSNASNSTKPTMKTSVYAISTQPDETKPFSLKEACQNMYTAPNLLSGAYKNTNIDYGLDACNSLPCFQCKCGDVYNTNAQEDTFIFSRLYNNCNDNKLVNNEMSEDAFAAEINAMKEEHEKRMASRSEYHLNASNPENDPYMYYHSRVQELIDSLKSVETSKYSRKTGSKTI